MKIDAVKEYIKKSWITLSRSHRDLISALSDAKVNNDQDFSWLVYISAKEKYSHIEQKLQKALNPQAFNQIEIRTLPDDFQQIKEHGLLYLPYPYVVPGGRFNELYGWDSYFILLGLLRDGELTLAKNIVDNFIYQIEHYGVILNANRTYFLTRSQPPFLTLMILAVFNQIQNQKWLKSTLPIVEKYYDFWTRVPHLEETTGLSRYFDFSDEPASEVISSERDETGRTHYDRVREYYRLHSHEIKDYDVSQYYDRQSDCLTPLFYRGDRSMRESGFDPSNRFGKFNVDVIHYTPVCLNVLLYQIEKDTAHIYEIIGDKEKASQWRQRAQKRCHLINNFLWDEQVGLYFDYNFFSNKRRPYKFATTFYPLWAGIASPEQAKRVVEHLPEFEEPGGLLTSTYVTGHQWDAPFGWGPLQLIAVQGLSNYGYNDHARRLADKFISLVVEEFEKSGTIVEKYDVFQRSADVSDKIQFGYSSNEIGFGWTNGVILELLGMVQKKSI